MTARFCVRITSNIGSLFGLGSLEHQRHATVRGSLAVFRHANVIGSLSSRGTLIHIRVICASSARFRLLGSLSAFGTLCVNGSLSHCGSLLLAGSPLVIGPDLHSARGKLKQPHFSYLPLSA